MAVYIDNLIYTNRPERDDTKIYEYIYHITYMLACKAKMFEKGSDYDEFSLYSAGKVYGRLVNEKQFTEDPDKKKLEKITSVLNYIKNSLYGMKVSYQKESFNQVFDSELGFDGNGLIQSLKSNIQSDYNSGLRDAILEAIEKVPHITRKVIKSTPYSSDPVMARRLYMSCLLSFLNSIKLPNKIKQKLEKKEASKNNVDLLKIDFIDEQFNNSVILWRLDDLLYDYVDVLVKRVKHTLVEDIGGTMTAFELPEEVLTQIIKSPLADYTNHNVEDD